MTTRLKVLSAFGGFTETMHVDDTRPGQLLISTSEECAPLVEHAKVLADLPPGKDYRHAAVIPMHVMDKAFREGWFNDRKAWKKWANDPSNRAFRTWPGNL